MIKHTNHALAANMLAGVACEIRASNNMSSQNICATCAADLKRDVSFLAVFASVRLRKSSIHSCSAGAAQNQCRGSCRPIRHDICQSTVSRHLKGVYVARTRWLGRPTRPLTLQRQNVDRHLCVLLPLDFRALSRTSTEQPLLPEPVVAGYESCKLLRRRESALCRNIGRRASLFDARRPPPRDAVPTTSPLRHMTLFSGIAAMSSLDTECSSKWSWMCTLFSGLAAMSSLDTECSSNRSWKFSIDCVCQCNFVSKSRPERLHSS